MYSNEVACANSVGIAPDTLFAPFDNITSINLKFNYDQVILFVKKNEYLTDIHKL